MALGSVQGRTAVTPPDSPPPGRARRIARAIKRFFSRAVHVISHPGQWFRRRHSDSMPDQKVVHERQADVLSDLKDKQEPDTSGALNTSLNSSLDSRQFSLPDRGSFHEDDLESVHEPVVDDQAAEQLAAKSKARGRWKLGKAAARFQEAGKQAPQPDTVEPKTVEEVSPKSSQPVNSGTKSKVEQSTESSISSRVGSFFRSVFVTKPMSFVRSLSKEKEPEVDPLDSDQTIVGKAVKSGLITRDKADAMRQKYSNEIVDVLLKTPYLQEQTEKGLPLADDELDMLDQIAARLNGLRLIAHRPESVLQRQADAMLGRTLDLGDASHLCPVVTRYIMRLSDTIPDDYDKKIALKRMMLHVLKKAQEAEANPGSKSYSELYRSLKQLKHAVRQERTRQTVAMLQNRVRENALTIVKREFKEKLKQQLAGLNEAGAERSVELNLDLELDGGLFGINLLGGNIGLQYEFKAEAGDDGRIRDQHGTSVTMGLTLGNDVIKGQAAVGGGGGKERTFDSLDDFIEFHANDLLTALLTRKPGNTRHARHVKQLDDLHSRNVAENEQLQQRLVEVGVIAGGDKVEATPGRKPAFLEGNILKMKASVGVSMLDDMMSGEYEIENSVTRFKKRTEWMDALKDRPELVDDMPPQCFSFVWNGEIQTGEEGHAWLQRLEQGLQKQAGNYQKAVGPTKKLVHQKQLVARHSLKQAISLLYAEFDHYCAVVNRYEGRFKSGNKAAIRDIKHKMETARGADGRGDYLKRLIATHSRLERAYKMTFNPGEAPVTHDGAFMTLLDTMETDYRTPRVNLSMINVKTLSAKQKAKSKSLTQTGLFTFKIPETKYELSAEVSYEKTKGHPNPDFDGTSASVSFTLSGGAMLSSALKAFKGNPPGLTALGFAKNEEWLSLGEDILPDLGLEFDSDVQVAFNLAKAEKGWRLENLRVMAGDRLGLKSPTVSIPAGGWGDLKLQAGASLSSVDKLYERIGDDTTGYIQTRFNGWSAQGEIEGEGSCWKAFVKDNEKQLHSLMKNIGTGGTNARKEFKELIKDLKKADGLKKEEVKELREALYQDAEKEQYAEALKKFETVLALQYQHLYLKEAHSRFGKLKV